MSECVKEKAFEQFLERYNYSALIEKIDSLGLHAGSPHYFYCKACGTPTEVLLEEFIFSPHSLCSQCQGLEQKGWLDDAKNLIKK